jgi:hypothetical protein
LFPDPAKFALKTPKKYPFFWRRVPSRNYSSRVGTDQGASHKVIRGPVLVGHGRIQFGVWCNSYELSLLLQGYRS